MQIPIYDPLWLTLQGIITGILSGAITSLLGYAKSVTSETFDKDKAIQTLIVGAFIGGIAGYYGWTFEKAETWATDIGLITVFEYVKKALIRYIKKKLQERKEEAA